MLGAPKSSARPCIYIVFCRLKKGQYRKTIENLWKGGVLYRLAKKGKETVKQLLVPKTKREEVLRLAHESLLGGHLGIAKTREKVVRTFYWPGVHGDVKRFCLSCDKCQRMSPRTNQRPL